MNNETLSILIFMGVSAAIIWSVTHIPDYILKYKIKRVKVGAVYESNFKDMSDRAVVIAVDHETGIMRYKMKITGNEYTTEIRGFVNNWSRI